jgi:hypothetical protein
MLSLVYVPEKNYSLMFGGQIDVSGSSFEPRSDLFILNVTSHSRWTPVPTVGETPSARCGHSASLVDSHMFVWGGRGQKQLSEPDPYVLDIKKREWMRLQSTGPVPSARFQHVSWTVNDKVYIFGGHDGRRTCFHDLFAVRVDVASKQAVWEEIKPHGEMPKLSGAAASTQLGDQLITIGGSDAQAFSNDVFAYSTSENLWRKFTSVGHVPSARAALSAFSMYGRLFAFGGSNGQLRFNDLYVIDLDVASGIATWARFPLAGDVPDGRSLHAAAIDRDNNVFIYGGWNGTSCYGDLHVLTLFPAPPPQPPAQFSLESVLGDPSLSDCTLICDGERFAAHRAILAARSRIFRFWIESWGDVREVRVSDMSAAVLRSLLRFMYAGRAIITPGTAADVLLAADKYALDGLRAAAARELTATLSFGNVDLCVSLAEALDMGALRSAALLFNASNQKHVLEHRARSATAPLPRPAPPVAAAAALTASPQPSPMSALPCPISLRSASPAIVTPRAALLVPPSVAQPSRAAPAALLCGKRKTRGSDDACSSSSSSGSDDDSGVLSAPPLAPPSPPYGDDDRMEIQVEAAAAATIQVQEESEESVAVASPARRRRVVMAAVAAYQHSPVLPIVSLNFMGGSSA